MNNIYCKLCLRNVHYNNTSRARDLLLYDLYVFLELNIAEYVIMYMVKLAIALKALYMKMIQVISV